MHVDNLRGAYAASQDGSREAMNPETILERQLRVLTAVLISIAFVLANQQLRHKLLVYKLGTGLTFVLPHHAFVWFLILWTHESNSLPHERITLCKVSRRVLQGSPLAKQGRPNVNVDFNVIGMCCQIG